MIEAPLSLRITLRGSVLGLLALGAVGIGLYRKELASLLWGIGILLLWGTAFVSVGISSFLSYRRRNEIIEFLHLAMHPPEPLYAGSSVQFHLSFSSHPTVKILRIPGVLFTYRYKVTSWDVRTFSWSLPLKRKTLAYTCSPPPPLRGDYQGSIGHLHAEDPFGFFVGRVTLPYLIHFPVLPDPSLSPALRTLEAPGGEVHPAHQKPFVALEELEIRKYMPGDDVRRLHWKLFAHSGELFLRIGESDPPPQDTVHIHFDLTPSIHLHPSFFLPASDRMAAIGAWYLRNLSEAGKQIILSLGTSSPPVSLDPGHPDKGLEELARMYPDTGLSFSREGALLPGESLTPLPQTALPAERPLLLFLFVGSPRTEIALEYAASERETVQVCFVHPTEGMGPRHARSRKERRALNSSLQEIEKEAAELTLRIGGESHVLLF